ncbi:hypothetical protein NKH72_21745 [Mesorhizobium sp. M0955]|uniref:hypothetical protein n=1 Tax=Mesorhizobium sp. M0955 TaxID=2957033 RepID=UPI00333DE4E4
MTGNLTTQIHRKVDQARAYNRARLEACERLAENEDLDRQAMKAIEGSHPTNPEVPA